MAKLKKALDVLDHQGKYIRTFSEEIHGKKYVKLAETFARKVAGRKVIPAIKREE